MSRWAAWRNRRRARRAAFLLDAVQYDTRTGMLTVPDLSTEQAEQIRAALQRLRSIPTGQSAGPLPERPRCPHA